MDFTLLQISLISVMLSGLRGNEIATTPSITSYMNHVVSLPCTFTSETMVDDWIMTRWTRYVNDSYDIQLATMVNRLFEAEWSKTAPENFQDHVELRGDRKTNNVTMTMVIDGYQCTDVGKYKCQIVTMDGDKKAETELHILAHPGMPVITPDTLEVSENSSFVITCNANVGLPASPLSWKRKLAGTPVFEILEGPMITQTNWNSSHDCTMEGQSEIRLTMTEALDGAVYLCYTNTPLGNSNGANGKPLQSDEVQLILHGKTTTTVSTTSSKLVITTLDDTSGAGVIKISAVIVLAWTVSINCLTSLTKYS